MKKVIVVVAVLLLAGCGKADRAIASWTGGGTTSCEGGVEYLQFTSGVSVAYTPDGKIKTCN